MWFRRSKPKFQFRDRPSNAKKIARLQKRFAIEPLEGRLLLSVAAIPTVADSGTPFDPNAPSANVSQAITITGSNFTPTSVVSFSVIDHNTGAISTQNATPTRVAADGTNLDVIVPDQAMTAIVRVDGFTSPKALQIVPTIVDIDLTSPTFATGSSFTILGSGFIEGDMTIRFGATEVVDTSISSGPDVFSVTVGAGFDKAGNDGVSVAVPAGAATGPITVKTAGGTSAPLLVSLSQITSQALEGTPALSTQASANPGQSIRVLGSGFDYTTDVIFPTIGTTGVLSNTVVNPHFISPNGSLMEVIVPEDAISGSVRVVGAAGAFALQVVPTLELVEDFGSNQFRLLGSGFTEDANLSVNFTGAPAVIDSGASIDVATSFLANDTLTVTKPASGTGPVSVTTAGGTSASVAISIDRPASVTGLNDLAIFPVTAGADAGRFLITDASGNVSVLDPATLALIRTITRPGTGGSLVGLTFLGDATVVQDAVRGNVNVPAGTLVLVNGNDLPDRLYYLNPTGAGTVLADVALAGPTPVDENGASSVVYHSGRKTFFVLRSGTDVVTEINPATGAAIQSFHIGGAVSNGGIAVHPVRGTLLVGGNSSVLEEVDPVTGRLIGNYDPVGNVQLGSIDLRQEGVSFQGFGDISGLAFNSSGQLLAAVAGGRILSIALPAAPTALRVNSVLAQALAGNPADPLSPSANAGQRISLLGSGYNLSTQVEFEIVNNGVRTFQRVQVDAVNATGTEIQVVVPTRAVTGKVKVSGAPGDGLFLQIVPTIRPIIPADGNPNFADPIEGIGYRFFGSGLVEGATTITMGGIIIDDNSISSLVSEGGGWFQFVLPERTLAGPIRVDTAGGNYTVATVPIDSQKSVGLTAIVASSLTGAPTNVGLPSANTAQTITLLGYGFTSSSNIIFQGVAHDGTRSVIVTRPSSVTNGGLMTVVVPDLAVTGLVTVAGSATSIQLQIVPTLDGISVNTLTPGAAIRLSGTGIPEGGTGVGESVVYTFGAGSITDINAITGPDVFSALEKADEIDLNVPGGSTGSVVTVTTAGGTAILQLANLTTPVVAAEPQGAAAVDGIGGTLATARNVPLDDNTRLTLSGRVNVAQDVDVYQLVGAQRGAILSVSLTLGNNIGLVLFDGNGVALTSPSFNSFANLVLPAAGTYYLGVSGWSNVNYNVVTGAGAINGTVGDYTLALRYSDPGTTSLNAITTTAARGIPTNPVIASANTGQTITITGENFDATTRVRFTTFNSNSPQFGLGETEVVPTSVAGDGLSLQVVVPSEAVTGVVRLTPETGGLILQIVPFINDYDTTSGTYEDGSNLQFIGGGFVEGAQTLIMGTAIGAGGATEVTDLWNFTGPDTFNSGTINSGVNFAIPGLPPTGPFLIRTLGGTSDSPVTSFTSITSTSSLGTPASALLPSANVRQAITLHGSGFNAQTEIVFAIRNSSSTDADILLTTILNPSQVSADGTSLQVLVPDNAVTGNIHVVGAEDGVFLQVVPTLVQVITPSPFITGGTMTIRGSGFTENDIQIVLGGTVLKDTNAFFGPDVFNGTIGAGLDRNDNDHINFLLPPGASTAPLIIRTAGGEATLVSVNGIQGLALEGTPANAAIPSANAGQTIRIFGQGLNLSTEVIFQIVDTFGNLSTVVLRPDLASTDGTLAELRVPDNAITGAIQVVGAAGTFSLQIVPTLKLVEEDPGTRFLRLLGGGFTDDRNLSVNFTVGGSIIDTGTSIDVFSNNNFLVNDTLYVTRPVGAAGPVSVTTAGGTSSSVAIPNDEPASIAGINDLSVFPTTAGADAGRYVITDASGNLQVIDPTTLALIRNITRPGTAGTLIGVTFLGAPVVVQDAVRGAVNVAAGSMVVVNGNDLPDRLYYLNPAGSGTILADVALGGPTPVDDNGATSVVYHSGRGTLFVQRNSTDLITEINPATGAAIQSFHSGYNASGGRGALAVHPVRGTLLVGNDGTTLVEIDPATGRLVGHYDAVTNTQHGALNLVQDGVSFESFGSVSGLAFNSAGQLFATVLNGRILDLTLPSAPTAIQLANGSMAVAIDGVPANPSLPSANARQRIRIVGAGYNRFTQVEFQTIGSGPGLEGYISVRVDAVSGDGTAIEVVVPDTAVTGFVRIAGVPGGDLFLQITPTIRATLPSDPNINFDVPVEEQRWGLFGSGLIEGNTVVTFGGIVIADNSGDSLIDIQAVSGTNYFRDNGRLDLNVPAGALAGPVRVTTAGGYFEVSTIPIESQESVGLTSIIAAAPVGIPANVLLPSANTGQVITLQGFGFTSSSNIIFQGVALDGTRGVIVVRPSSVSSLTQMTVQVPERAITGAVTVAGSTTSVDLQIVPTLDGISVGSLIPGAAIRLSGSGIPEGGPGAGQQVTYTFGAGNVVDNGGASGPDVFSALEEAVEISLNVPAGATGTTVTVTTLGGSATLQLANVTKPVFNAEPQGAAAADGVGATLASAANLTLDDNAQLTVNGRVNTATDIDVYHLNGAQRGGILSVTAVGGQGNSMSLILFDGNGAVLNSAAFNSFSNLLLPISGDYYLGVTGWAFTNYSVITGTGTGSGGTGDYALTVRYADPGATALNAITTTAARGTPANPSIASANTGQTITITGENFDANTRVRFTTFNGTSPQNGLTESGDIIPTSVAGDGLSLQVVVPADAVTGPVRLTAEPGGLILQIVPFINDYDMTSGSYDDGSNLQLNGGGFVEGAQTLLIGTSGLERADVWNFTGADIFGSGGTNNFVNVALPRLAPTGPFAIRTLGGTSDTAVVTFSGITATAAQGTPANALLPSTNVREGITLSGTGFNAQTEVVFLVRDSQSTDADIVSTQIVNPLQVAADGTSLQVLVPDTAVTGNIRVVGSSAAFFLQIVPTLVQIITPSPFITGGTMTVTGSGFTENDIQIVLGNTILKDTSAFFGPDVFNAGIGAGLDRNDNDHLNLVLPPGTTTSSIRVITSGGEASISQTASIQSVALSGTPGNAGVASANAGQTIRILGAGLSLSTEVIFPIIDTFGTISTIVLRPDLVSTNGTLAEIRVPDNAVTGTLQVVGAAGSFALQIVPTLKLVEEDPGTRLLRVLGGGFTDDSNLSVNFAVGGSIIDNGTSIDVFNNNNFIANDTLYVTRPVGASGPITVTTAGGTSAPVAIPNDEPTSIAGIYDLAIFPTTAGSDAGRYLIADSAGALQVIDPVTLAKIRDFARPGITGSFIGVTFLGAPIVVQDAVRGAVNVPAGSLVVVNGTDIPDRLYYMNTAGSGTILADVALGGQVPVDEAGATSVVYHSGRGTLFVMRNNTDLITEINPSTGAAIQSFHTNYAVSGGRGALAVHPVRGTLLIGGSTGVLVEIDPDTGRAIGNYSSETNVQFGVENLSQDGVNFENFGDLSGMAFNGSGQLISSVLGGRILRLTLPSTPTAIQLANGSMAVAIDGVPANASLPSANARQRIRIVGSGYNRFTQVEFQAVPSGSGSDSFVSVRADAVSADGTMIDVVVPDTAVTGFVRISGVSGGDLYLQITPTIRTPLPSDPSINFNVPIAEQRWGLFGSGLIEGNTVVTIGGIIVDDNSTDSLVDVQSVSGTNYTRDNGRLDLNIPPRALTGPVRVTTDGGYFEVPSSPIASQELVGLTAIVASALEGTPGNAGLPSANTGQVITLQGFGFAGSSIILFQAVAHDGTRGVIAVAPTSITSLTQMTVTVPDVAVTGAVTVAGSTTSVNLQVVPTLDGINVGLLTPGAPIRLSGTGIPEGGGAAGQQVTYTVGAGNVIDTSGTTGPDVFSALVEAVEINLNVPAGATGTLLTVTTAGGSATLQLANVTTPSVNAEAQGAAAVDAVGASLATTLNVTVDDNTRLTVNGRINTASDVDLYHLIGAQRGGILSVSAVGLQSNNMGLILFDGSGTALAGASFNAFSNFLLPVAGDYYLGVSGWANTTYNIITGTVTGTGGTGDYALTLRYADPGATSLNAITSTATRGTPANPAFASANTGQTITITGENFDANTRVRFTTFNDNAPQNGLTESEVIPTSVAGNGLSLQVVVPVDAVTGPVRLTPEPGGLILQIVPFINDYDMTSSTYDDGSNLQINGGGFVDGAESLLIGTSGLVKTDLWNSVGPDAFSSAGTNNFINVGLPVLPPTGPFYIRTLGGTSDTPVITFTGVAPGTVADRGTPTDTGLPSLNVRETLTLLGSGFNAQTEIVFVVRDSSSSNSDIEQTTIVNPASVAANGTSLTVVVPDTAATGFVHIVGVEDGFFLQIVPTIVQVILPGTFATGQNIGIQGSGFIENDVVIGVGNTLVLDTSAFFGPDVFNTNINLAGLDRADNDAINVAVPPGGTPGPWTVTTAGGTARFGVIIDLGVVIYETSLNRTVAPGEQELFKATASIDGWLDWEVHYSGASAANLKVLNQDGTDATLVDFVTNGPDVLMRVSANKNQIFFLRTNGVGTVATYDVKATNHDRFDDPVGAQAKPFRGSYGTDPDGRNDTALKATDFTPAVYVLEDLSIPVGDTDWLTVDAQATGQMTFSALFTAANGVLRFRVYTDANNNDILDPAELAAPIASSPNASGASSPVLPAARGQRFWIEVFSIDGNSDGVLDRNLYNLTFSNIDLVDAGLLAGHPANNDTRANAVEMGFGVAWNSSTITDALTIHNPSDIDWFGFTTAVPGTLTVLIDLEHPLVGQLVANVVDANTGVGLTLLEFENSGTRLRFLFSPVSADQHLNLQISGQPNAYKFSVQNNDVREPDPTMAQPANLGLVVHQLLPQLSLPGLPDVGTRDDDWYQLITAAPDGQLRVTATVDPVTGGGGNVTVNIWRDSNGNGIPEAGLGELVATGTSVGGAPVTVNALAGQLETFFVQVFNPASGPLTGLEYTLDVADVDRFDRVAPNETSATATNFGSIVDRSEPGLTLLPFDQDWYKASMRAKDGTMNVLVNGQFDRLVINVFRDTNSDGTPDTLVATKAGKIFSIEDIPAVKNETLWIQVVLETPSNASAVGALYDLEVLNPDRYDDPLGDSVGGVVINPTGHDPDGPNDGPRTTGNVVEGTLRLVQPDPLVPSTMQGHVGVSVDGLGTFTTGSLQAVIPTGSTVQYAFLYVATRSFSTPYRPAGIGFAGSTVSLTYLPNVDNATGVDFETGRANVTSLVQGIVGSGGATYNFGVDERIANAALSADGNDNDLQKGIEGTALVVIYSNPTLPIRSIAILEGGLSGPAIQTTRMSLATPVNKADPNFIAQLSLGISFSFQPLGQSSTVNVNGTRMTSSAGNFNDGLAGNGSLVTVGGVGDSTANPSDPFNGGDTTDDELYDLSPFLTNGDREIVMETANPSDDDSIFLAVITVSGNAGVASLFTDLGTIGDVHEVDMTLPATDQDWYRIKAGETGDLVATATFESDGSAKALMFRDADDDGLPDDLNDDGVPDSIGVATIGPNSVTISNVPGVTVGAVFLLRVFDPVGQVEYNLDLTINQAPVAVVDSYTTAEDTVLNISAPGVLANDSDSDGNPLTSILNSGVGHGVLTLNGNGSFTYTPTANYNGPDSFTYHDTDGLSNSNVVTVSINVTPVNDAPVAANDSYTTNEDTPLTITVPGVLANDTDVDGNSLTSLLNAGVSHGVLTLNPNGSFTYTPTANYSGPDSFTYHASDGTLNSNIATVSITVTPVNDAPVALNDSYTTNEDTVLNIVAPGVLANDTDADGNALTSVLNTTTSNGVLTLNANGSFAYTPNANFNGTDSFTYHANDSTANSNIATVTITVTPVNDAPVAANDSYTTAEDTALVVSSVLGVLANDTDVDNVTLTAVLNTTTTNGALTLNANGSFTYTPNLNFNGTDSFTYHANDTAANSNIATVTITVTPVNDAPVAVNDSYTTAEDTPLVVNSVLGVLANDTDVDNVTLTAVLNTTTTNGALTLNANGSFTYTPNLNFNGTDSFTYHANDTAANSNIATVTITVTPVNDAPVAVNDSYTTNEDTPLTITAPGVLGNDMDVDNVTLTAILNVGVNHGALTLNANGSFTYTPTANYNGPDSFTYHASDGTLNSNIATVTITVTPVNDAPVAVNDTYSTSEDTPLTIAAPGVLGNDTDVDSVSLTAVLNTSTANGTLTLNGVGSFTYTPNANFNGTDSFTYHATDGTANSNIATVTITVTPVNDAPVAVNDSYTTNEDTPLTIAAPGVLGNDTDVDNVTLMAVLNTSTANGTLTLNGVGSFTYTPNANFNGTDSFTYHATDGTANSNIATVTITVTPVNDAPVAVNDSYSTNEDTPLTITAPGVLSNDSDVDGNPLAAILNVGPVSGVLSLNPNGSFTYTPNANFNGTDSFTYHATDGTANSNIATVTVTVNAVNDAPVAVNDSYSTNEDTLLTISAPGVLANDTDVESVSLTAVLNTTTSHGALTLNSTGSFTYTPVANFNGTDSFTYHANDGTANSNIATVTITVNPVNDAPVAVNDSYTTNEDTPLTITAPGVLSNDSDGDGNPLTAILNVGPVSGILSLNPNGSFTYTPNSNFNGSDSFTYHAFDGTANSNIATVSITVNAVNDALVANNDNYTTNEDTQLTITAPGVLSNDSDVDGTPIAAVLNVGPASGVLTLNANGSFTYAPNANFNGTDTFTYHASDGTSSSNIATVTITVTPVNDAPIAANDSYTTNEDTVLTITAPGVLGNDTDVDTGSLTAVLNTTTSNGSLTLNAAGSFTYTPNANFNGTDSFTYHASDGTLNSNIATVTITVAPVNDAPSANNDSYTTNEDTPLTISAPGILANDTDIDSVSLTAVLNTTTTSGTLALNANGSFTYTPNANFNGTDSFTYHANDGAASSNIATVTIAVTPVNDAPVANNDSYSTNEDGALTVIVPGVLANDTDIEGSPLTAVLNLGPASGSLTLNANGSFTYTPNANFNGTDSFTYHANDGAASSNIATVTIAVTPVNDAPVANNDSYSTNEDGALTVIVPGVLANDTDVDGNPLTAAVNVGPASGSLTLNANGSFTYTPNANFNGTDSFTYHANDGTLNSNSATVTITVNAVNDAPVANNDTYATNQNTLLSIAAPGVLANDTDIDGNLLSAVLNVGPASGVLSLNANGSFTYTPNANFSGTDSFTYHANDGTANSNIATVTITVNSVNGAPVANNDTYSVNEDGTLNVAVAGVLTNDTDVDGNTLTALVGTGPASGVLALNSNGSFTYTPNANFNGTDSFTYRANDGTTNSNLATVTITVNPVNDAPVANNDSYSLNEDGTLNVAAAGVLTNDTDVDGNPLASVLGTGPTSGNLTLNPNGSFTYTPNANFNGTDSFTYRANDGTVNSNLATVTITVNPVNDAPVANNDAYSVNEDGTLNIAAPGVLANDTDVEASPLTALLGAGPASGSLTLKANGSFIYTPNANFNGTDSFTYRATDGTANSNAAKVTITVNPLNDAPVANNDAYAVNEDGTLNVAAAGVLINDTDVDGNPLTSVLGTGPASGSMTLNSNGSFTYTPNANFNGTDTFTYRANDGTTNSNAATVTITVNAVNDAPVANNDSYTTNQGMTLTVAAPGVLANDTDVDGNPLTAALVTGPASGSLTLNANGSFTYTPNANFNGADTFTYRAKDGTLDSNLATVTVTVNGSNTAPVATDDCYTTNEDTSLTVALPGLLANDSDTDGNALTAVLVAGPAHGTLTLNANGSFTYTPNSNFNGDDTFTYRANDGTADSNIAKVTITVCPINDAPVANNDSYITNQNTPLTVTIPGVLANDTDAEGSALTAVLNSGPSHGTLTLNANGSFTYTSSTGYTGSDSFTYRASDGTTTSDIATVVITVNPVANAPLVTAPASITIAATSAGGATAITSPLLAAFLASGSAMDSTDPAPVRLTPQINGVDVTSSTQFALGTTAVTFRYKNAMGQIGTATSYVNVIVGSVSIANSITGKGVDASGNYYVDLKLTNTGTGNAINLAITEASFRTLTGTGSVSLLNPGTISVGNLAAGASTTIHILLNRPVTVKRFSFTQNMSFEDVTGASFSASASQTVIP